MTRTRVAVIDLGSNTFHVLICEILPGRTWTLILKDRIYVKLASGGLSHIGDDATIRAVDAMMRFAEQIRAYGVTRTKAIGTSALREAVNGREVAGKIAMLSGIPVEIIDGHKEAWYIWKGITTVLPVFDRYGLIMDIGGGSVEFILYLQDHIAFKESYRIGVAELYRRFHHTDPIAPGEVQELEAYLGQELAGLQAVVSSVPGYYLIGASGSFEVIHDVQPRAKEEKYWSEIEMTGLFPYLNEIIATDIPSRREIPEIPVERLDYIVVAYILIRFVLKKMPPEKLYYCDFALKEGVLAEMVGEL